MPPPDWIILRSRKYIACRIDRLEKIANECRLGSPVAHLPVRTAFGLIFLDSIHRVDTVVWTTSSMCTGRKKVFRQWWRPSLQKKERWYEAYVWLSSTVQSSSRNGWIKEAMEESILMTAKERSTTTAYIGLLGQSVQQAYNTAMLNLERSY